MNKHSFCEVEEVQNERLKEELSFAIINDLKMARQAEGILTLNDIAKCIEEGLGDDAKVLGALLYIKNVEGFDKKNGHIYAKVEPMATQKKDYWVDKLAFGI